MVKSMSWTYFQAAPSVRPARRLLAVVLRGASYVLGRMARRLMAAERSGATKRAPVQLEFYAEAGAPEGAMYADGRLIGYIDGVSRL